MLIYCICTQYLVGSPFALITASIRRGMEVISLWHCWGGMEAQVSLTVAFSSSAFFGLLFLIFLLTIPHSFNILIYTPERAYYIPNIKLKIMLYEPFYVKCGLKIYWEVWKFESGKCAGTPRQCIHILILICLPVYNMIINKMYTYCDTISRPTWNMGTLNSTKHSADFNWLQCTQIPYGLDFDIYKEAAFPWWILMYYYKHAQT